MKTTKVKAGVYRLSLKGHVCVVRKAGRRWRVHTMAHDKVLGSYDTLADAKHAFRVHVSSALVFNATPNERAERADAKAHRQAQADYAKVRNRTLASAINGRPNKADQERFDRAARNIVERAVGEDNATGADWLQAAYRVKVECSACDGSGEYRGKGLCFRCQGRGYQTYGDARRNWGYANRRKASAS